MARPRMTLIPSCSSSASVTVENRTRSCGRQPGLTCPAYLRRRHAPDGAPRSGRDRGAAARACSRSSATDAVNPWRKFRPPTGPSSPAAKNPAIGTGPRCSVSTRTSWWGAPNSRVPRPLQVKTRAASARRAVDQRVEVLVGGGGVAEMELHGRADRHGRRRRRWRRWSGPRPPRCAPGSRRARSAPCARR